jgi:hypothetical protein
MGLLGCYVVDRYISTKLHGIKSHKTVISITYLKVKFFQCLIKMCEAVELYNSTILDLGTTWR